jgi:lipoate-protein ligase B
MALCKVEDLGCVDYQQAYDTQTQYVDQLLRGGSQMLLLCEHPPVLTLGRLADEKHMLLSPAEIRRRGVDIHHIDRGGDITLHAPGQLVVYPILDLTRFGKDLRLYLHGLEEVAIDLLNDFGIVASRFLGQTGVWAGDKKIVSIGIGVRKWISFHGLAVNVNTDLSLFSMIKPCGLNVEMTSMAAVKGHPLDMAEVKVRLARHFIQSFHLTREKNVD